MQTRYYLMPDKPRDAMKHTTIIFYAGDSATAKELAIQEREAHRHGFTRDATVFTGEREDADVVVVMDDVKGHHRKRIEMAYGDKVMPMASLADASFAANYDPKPAKVAGLPAFDGTWPTGDEYVEPKDETEDLSVDPGPAAVDFAPVEVPEKPFKEPNVERHQELMVMPFAGLQKIARELSIKNPHQIKRTTLIEQILELE